MELTKNFKPLRGLVLIKRDKQEAEKGGIIIPEAYRQYGWCAEVVAVGEDVVNVKRGDRIMFKKEFCVLPFKDRLMGITDADKILAKLCVEVGIERIVPINHKVLILPESKLEPADEVVMPSKTSETAVGIVEFASADCKNISDGVRVWYPTDKTVNCIENDERYVIIDECDILIVETV